MNIKTIVSIISILIGLVFIIAGSGKFNATSIIAENFDEWGYSTLFMHCTGVAEILGGLGLMFSRTRIGSVFLLISVMLGASITHILNYKKLGVPLFPLGLIVVLILIYIINKKRLKAGN